MASDQGTKDQMILGFLKSSQCKPKVGVLCTVLLSDVQGWTTLSKTVHKTPTLGLSCELIKKTQNNLVFYSLVRFFFLNLGAESQWDNRHPLGKTFLV